MTQPKIGSWKPIRDVSLCLRAELKLKKELQSERARLRALIRSESGMADIIGVSAPMQRLFRVLEQVAPTDATVLTLGETGTGAGARTLIERR